MEEFRYDTYCGLYCGACDIMNAFRDAAESKRQPQWDDIPAQLRNHIPVSKTTEIKCFGCKTDTVFGGCSKCPVRKCAKEKMQADFCFECPKYPCFRFRIFSVIRKLIQKRLPHIKSAYKNQVMIQEKGIHAWLAEQEALWKCPQCNTHFTWYMKSCRQCGYPVEYINL
jgi:hypothetical protein